MPLLIPTGQGCHTTVPLRTGFGHNHRSFRSEDASLGKQRRHLFIWQTVLVCNLRLFWPQITAQALWVVAKDRLHYHGHVFRVPSFCGLARASRACCFVEHCLQIAVQPCTGWSAALAIVVVTLLHCAMCQPWPLLLSSFKMSPCVNGVRVCGWVNREVETSWMFDIVNRNRV